MSFKFRYILLSAFAVVIMIAGLIWDFIAGWPPIVIRDGEYQKLMNDYKAATRIDKLAGSDQKNSTIGWEFSVVLPDRNEKIDIKAPSWGVVTIKYEGEDRWIPLYGYVDYSSPVEIRTYKNLIYVHWAESLLSRTDRIIVYDLANRREVLRRRISPKDKI